ncbi:hypothetical protein LCGC14_2617560 [marine sediment metagenome]|uniref:DUF2190 family protein n=1 Tax=marine sediment metagenome TaxID=412755 RepID=A0A0F9A4A3_9ZZZZ
MALKQRENIVNAFTMPVGGVDIARGSVCIITSSALVVATGNLADAIFITTEIGFADKTVRCAGLGSIVFVIATDANLAEGEWWIPVADGKMDSIAALNGGTQYYAGLGLQDSSADGQLVAMWFIPGIAPDAA